MWQASTCTRACAHECAQVDECLAVLWCEMKPTPHLPVLCAQGGFKWVGTRRVTCVCMVCMHRTFQFCVPRIFSATSWLMGSSSTLRT